MAYSNTPVATTTVHPSSMVANVQKIDNSFDHLTYTHVPHAPRSKALPIESPPSSTIAPSERRTKALPIVTPPPSKPLPQAPRSKALAIESPSESEQPPKSQRSAPPSVGGGSSTDKEKKRCRPSQKKRIARKKREAKNSSQSDSGADDTASLASMTRMDILPNRGQASSQDMQIDEAMGIVDMQISGKTGDGQKQVVGNSNVTTTTTTRDPFAMERVSSRVSNAGKTVGTQGNGFTSGNAAGMHNMSNNAEYAKTNGVSEGGMKGGRAGKVENESTNCNGNIANGNMANGNMANGNIANGNVGNRHDDETNGNGLPPNFGLGNKEWSKFVPPMMDGKLPFNACGGFFGQAQQMPSGMNCSMWMHPQSGGMMFATANGESSKNGTGEQNGSGTQTDSGDRYVVIPYFFVVKL